MQIRAYYVHKYKSKVYFNERELQKELPPTMTQDINHHLYGELLHKIPLLTGLGRHVLNRVFPLCCMPCFEVYQISSSHILRYCC